jgi:putative (di)nucleoside polyphosphate hydrolase
MAEAMAGFEQHAFRCRFPSSFVDALCRLMEECSQYWINKVKSVIDADGFRPNVGIMIANEQGQLLWARRVGQNAWQFPQGGIKANESPQQALFRELHEEIGLTADDVQVLACTRGWLRYRLPRRMVRTHSRPVCIGQKQKWFLLRIRCQDSRVCVDGTPKPEFDGWRWVSYWYPLGQVVPFKREVYRRALRELSPRAQRLALGLE